MPEPFRTDDELVSAVLDGEATAEERARVAADPVLSARLAEFAAVADEVSAPVPPPSAGSRDAAIAAALAEARRPEEVVVALRPRRRFDGSFLAVAAAVLAVLLFAGFLIGQVGDSGTEDSASSSDDTAAADGAESAGEALSDEESGGTTAESESGDAAAFDDAPPVELGAVAEETELRAALVASGALDAVAASPTTRSTLPPTTTPSDADAVDGDSEDCRVRLEESDPALAGSLVSGTATYAGTPAVVYVFATVDGDTRVAVVTADTCRALVSFPL